MRLRELAHATLAGDLDPAALRALPAEEGLAALRRLPGIGRFRRADPGPRRRAPRRGAEREPRIRAAVARAYGVAELDDERLTVIADGWRPYRSWVSFLLRNAADADSR